MVGPYVRLYRGGSPHLAVARRTPQTQPPKLVAVALANKIARIAWKLMVSGENYRANKRYRQMPSVIICPPQQGQRWVAGRATAA